MNSKVEHEDSKKSFWIPRCFLLGRWLFFLYGICVFYVFRIANFLFLHILCHCYNLNWPFLLNGSQIHPLVDYDPVLGVIWETDRTGLRVFQELNKLLWGWGAVGKERSQAATFRIWWTQAPTNSQEGSSLSNLGRKMYWALVKVSHRSFLTFK